MQTSNLVSFTQEKQQLAQLLMWGGGETAGEKKHPAIKRVYLIFLVSFLQNTHEAHAAPGVTVHRGSG